MTRRERDNYDEATDDLFSFFKALLGATGVFTLIFMIILSFFTETISNTTLDNICKDKFGEHALYKGLDAHNGIIECKIIPPKQTQEYVVGVSP